MSFDGVKSEPKNLFLNNLIALDFWTSTELYRMRRYANSIYGMEQILAMIGAHNVPELSEIAQQIERYANSGTGDILKIKELFRELQKYLYKQWFSELNLGVVPTSTLQGETIKPDSAPLDPNQTNQI
jgi:hypothetical protein